MTPQSTNNSKNSHWADVEEVGAFWGLNFLAIVYKIAGRHICRLFMLPVLLSFYFMTSEGREAVREFRTKVSKRSGNNMPGFWTGFANYLQFGTAAMDKLAAWRGDITREKISIEGGLESLFELDPEEKGAVLFVSHLGNMELMRAFKSLNNQRPVTVLVHTKHAQRFNRLMTRFNPTSQLRLIEVTEITPDVAAYLKTSVDEGGWVVIAADRPPVLGRGNIIWAPFLGEKAPFALGPYVLAHILEKPVYLVACLREGARFSVKWQKLTDRLVLERRNRQVSAEKWAASYAKWLEDLAIQYPDQWFNFFRFWSPPKELTNE
ncbi:hypothetical protein GUA87_06640 [Sneathiella sp. P13V-1]|uniref:LpxL/LpxP family acyltransferase n=1 Tax=Sneathiella sp. P13V-1 TaxID=2697366 RepID=UPI00187B69D2|nr:hypothetical protein [Sneathiella sp. P13V-1]MBE7636517.1 hypothetical protein [Sneathiella sp. P13V-1]